MTGFGKVVAGAAATSLLAGGAHAMGGARYIHGLEAGARTALAGYGMANIGVKMERDPLARIAVLNGVSGKEARAAAEATVLAVPGIAGVRWADDDAAADGIGPEDRDISAETAAVAPKGGN